MENNSLPEEFQELWKKVINEAENMPPLPEIVSLILKEIDNPDSQLKDLEKLIINDPTLTAIVLRISNSAFYGYSRNIDTVSKAVIVLGLATLKSIVIAASVFHSLNKNINGYGLGHGDLYRHALATAIGAKLIAKHIKYKEEEKIFIAGLLHDIGKQLLGPHILDYIDKIKKKAIAEKISFDIAETKILGFNHGDAGGEVAKLWKLPEFIYHTMKHHHNPSVCKKNNIIVEIVHMSDILAYSLKTGHGSDGEYYRPINRFFNKHNIDKEYQKKLLIDIAKQQESLLNSIIGS